MQDNIYICSRYYRLCITGTNDRIYKSLPANENSLFAVMEILANTSRQPVNRETTLFNISEKYDN